MWLVVRYMVKAAMPWFLLWLGGMCVFVVLMHFYG